MHKPSYERPLTDVLRDTNPGFPCSDTELLRRAVQSAGRGQPWAPRWRHVEDLFDLTPSSAVWLCRICEVDPDEGVGVDGPGPEEDDLSTRRWS